MKLVLAGILTASFFAFWAGCANPEPTATPTVPIAPRNEAIPADVTPADSSGSPAAVRELTPKDSTERVSVMAPEANVQPTITNGGTDAQFPSSFIARRDHYDASRTFADLIKPYFFARTATGELISADGEPDLILELAGNIKVRLRQGDQESYLDILALESELIGEHPIHKVYRLEAMGLSLDDGLAQRLRSDEFPNELFRTVRFEYLQGKETSGVIAEVFQDGTFLVIPFAIPPEWQSEGAPPKANVLDILPGTRIRFTPRSTETFRVALALNQKLDPDIGPKLALDHGGGAPPDDGFSQVELITAFPFMGSVYDTIFVGSDGHITLGSGDGSSSARDRNRHQSGPPRLSVLLTDLNPDCTGAVHTDVRPDRIVVTWDRVVHIERGAKDGCDTDVPTNTMQAVLYPDGTIDYLYGELDLQFFSQSGSNREAVIGVARGGTSDGIPGIDITGDLPLGMSAGVIYEEYRPEPQKPAGDPIASPTHFHVNPRALISGSSALARDYEQEILPLPFDQQRYPAVPLARKQCQVYRESVQDATYLSLLSSVGYKFSPVIPGDEDGKDSRPFGESLLSLLREGAGEGVRYFGFDAYWNAQLLARLEVPWIEECDTAGAVRRYRLTDGEEDRYYLTLRRTLEPNKEDRYKVVKLDKSGGGQEIYTAPGIMLMALPLPWDDNYWMISSEGWPAPAEGKPADPRWQSVYIVNINNPAEYREVEYPISKYPNAPKEGLYGAAAALSSDSKTLFNTLYGFTDEGGGLWAVDFTDENFFSDPARFTRIVEWDHMLSWVTLKEASEESPFRFIFVTGKEVASDFAMTATLLRLRNTGFESTVESKERLLRMVGWNPVPFGWQALDQGKFRVLVETHFDYESSLLPRAKGVYIVLVDASEDK